MTKRTRKSPRPRSDAQALFAAAETLLNERTNETDLRAVLENGLGAKFVWNEHAKDVAASATIAICAAAKLTVRGEEISKVTLGKDEATARLHRLLASAQQFARRQRIGASHLRLAIQQLTDEDKAQKQTAKDGPEPQTSRTASASEFAPSASETSASHSSHAFSSSEVTIAQSRSFAGSIAPTRIDSSSQVADVRLDTQRGFSATSDVEQKPNESEGAHIASDSVENAQHSLASTRREGFTTSAFGIGLPSSVSASDALERGGEKTDEASASQIRSRPNLPASASGVAYACTLRLL